MNINCDTAASPDSRPCCVKMLVRTVQKEGFSCNVSLRREIVDSKFNCFYLLRKGD